MTHKGIKERERLFLLYARNLSIYHPDVTDQFLCPICRTLFSRKALMCDPPEVALAHIIPKSVKGRLLTLVCRDCDNKIGSIFDSHIAREKKFYDWKQCGKSIVGRIKHKGSNLGVISNLKDNGKCFEIKLIKKQSNPKSFNQLLKYAKSDWSNFKFSLKIPIYNPQKRDFSMLYSSFLLMFYHFGYEYVLSTNAEIIRQAIIKSIKGIKHTYDLCKTIFILPKDLSEMPPSVPSLSILVKPKEMCCFFVVLPTPKTDEIARCVLLPGFGENGRKAYSHILGLTQSLGDCNLKLLPNDPTDRLLDPKYKYFGNWIWLNVI